MPAGDPVVVWRVGDALVAVPLESVVEVAAVDDRGRALSRDGALDLRAVPGLDPPQAPRRGVVVRAVGGVVALAADAVEGIRATRPSDTAAPPRWLTGIETDHIDRLVRVEGDRVAAVLRLDALPTP